MVMLVRTFFIFLYSISCKHRSKGTPKNIYSQSSKTCEQASDIDYSISKFNFYAEKILHLPVKLTKYTRFLKDNTQHFEIFRVQWILSSNAVKDFQFPCNIHFLIQFCIQCAFHVLLYNCLKINTIILVCNYVQNLEIVVLHLFLHNHSENY